MVLDIVIIGFGLTLGAQQLWIVARKPLPRNLKWVSVFLGLAGLCAAGDAAAHLAKLPPILSELALVGAVLCFLIWLLMIVSLARHNTSM